jgi:hypothetical protein
MSGSTGKRYALRFARVLADAPHLLCNAPECDTCAAPAFVRARERVANADRVCTEARAARVTRPFFGSRERIADAEHVFRVACRALAALHVERLAPYDPAHGVLGTWGKLLKGDTP